VKDWWVVFRAWKDASLLRRTVVTVAAFVMMTTLSITVMSVGAVAATHAVFHPAADSSASPKSSASAALSDPSRPPTDGAEDDDEAAKPHTGPGAGGLKTSSTTPFGKKGSHAKRNTPSDSEKAGENE
jgi:hypothetical protein